MANAAFKAILTLSAIDNMSRTVNGAMSKSMRSLDAFGARQQATGQAMLGTGAMIVAPLALATKSAIDFESAFTGVVKTWRGSEEQLAATRSGILAMSRDIPQSANDLSSIAEAAGQLGIASTSVLDFTRTIADLKETTNLGDEAAPQFAKFANITKMPQDKFDELGSTIVNLGNNMPTTEADILNFGMRIAGAGAQVDISQAKIMGLAAGLSSVGLEAEAGGTAISKTLIELANRTKTGGAGLEEVAKIAGQTSAQFKKSFEDDAAGATVSFIEGLGKVKEQGGNVFQVLESLSMSEVRLLDSLLRASGAGDLMRKSLALASDGWEDNNALTKEAQTRYNTTASRMKVFKNNVTALGIAVGGMLIPALQSMVGGLQSATDWINNASTAHPILTKAVVISAAALGGFLVVTGAVGYVVGTVSRGIAAMSTILTFLTAKTTWATVAKWAMVVADYALAAAQITVAAGSVLVGAAIGGLGAGLRALFSVTKIVTAAQWLWNAAMLANPIGLIIAAVAAVIGAITALVIYWDDLKAAFLESPTWVKIAIAPFLAGIWPLLAIAGAIRWVIDNWNDLPGAVNRAVDGALAFAGELWTGIKSVFDGIWTSISEFPAKAFEAGKKIITSITDGMAAVAMAPINFIGDVVSDIRDYLPFSPAKRGALRDIHRIRLVETVAEGMKPAPMVRAMQTATAATRQVLQPGSSGSALAGIPSGPGPQAAQPNQPRAAGNTQAITVNFSPVVNVAGAADPDGIRQQLMAMAPEIMRMIQQAAGRKAQVSFGAG